MASFTTYTERVLQPTPAVLTLKLMPLTLGHLMLLKAAQSQFLFGSVESIKRLGLREMIAEIVFAALVCSVTYDEFLQEVHTGQFQTETQKYIKRLTKQVKKMKQFSLYAEIATFANYIKDGTQSPYFIPKKDDDCEMESSGESPIDQDQTMISILMTECNWTLDDCHNRPYAESSSAFLLYLHNQKVIELKSREIYDLHVKTGLATKD